MLRAEAPTFTPASPGLATFDYQKGKLDVSAWLSPVSTALPSPTTSSVDSPWASLSPYQAPTGPPDITAFALPDAPYYCVGGVEGTTARPDDNHLPGHWTFFREEEKEEEEGDLAASALDFRLSGLEDLQNSVAGLLGRFDNPSEQGTCASTSAGGSAAEDSSGPSTPPSAEDEPCSPPPGLEEYVASQVTTPSAAPPHPWEQAAAPTPSPPPPATPPPAPPAGTPPASSPPKSRRGKRLAACNGEAAPGPRSIPSSPAAKAESADPADPPPLPARVRPVPSQANVAVTTVTLQNVPKKYTRDMVAARLEDAGFGGEFDFLYVPVDLKNKCNAGSVIVNFRTEEACERFSKDFHKARVKDKFPGSSGSKVCEVTASQVQGKDANAQKVWKSGLLMSLLADKPEWLPGLYDEEGKAVASPPEAE